ncbi:MAG: MerR family transcriptional regulator [Chloroflexota bacterium]
MASAGGNYAISELAGLAGATPRTIRYYVAQGLLPAPIGVGSGAHYTDDHLARLRLIRRLQRQHQPLSEIRERVSALSEGDIVDLLAAEDPSEPPPSSALEYLRGLLAPQPAPAAPPGLARPVAPVPPPLMTAATASSPALLRRAASLMPLRAAESAQVYATATDVPPAAPAASAPEAPAVEQRSQWDRIALTPNIEIHVRRPLGRLENRRVERLIAIARQVLREEQP